MAAIVASGNWLCAQEWQSENFIRTLREHRWLNAFYGWRLVACCLWSHRQYQWWERKQLALQLLSMLAVHVFQQKLRKVERHTVCLVEKWFTIRYFLKRWLDEGCFISRFSICYGVTSSEQGSTLLWGSGLYSIRTQWTRSGVSVPQSMKGTHLEALRSGTGTQNAI